MNIGAEGTFIYVSYLIFFFFTSEYCRYRLLVSVWVTQKTQKEINNKIDWKEDKLRLGLRTVFVCLCVLCVCVCVCADRDLQAKSVPSLDGLHSQSHATKNQVLTMQHNLLNNEQDEV